MSDAFKISYLHRRGWTLNLFGTWWAPGFTFTGPLQEAWKYELRYRSHVVR